MSIINKSQKFHMFQSTYTLAFISRKDYMESIRLLALSQQVNFYLLKLSTNTVVWGKYLDLSTVILFKYPLPLSFLKELPLKSQISTVPWSFSGYLNSYHHVFWLFSLWPFFPCHIRDSKLMFLKLQSRSLSGYRSQAKIKD